MTISEGHTQGLVPNTICATEPTDASGQEELGSAHTPRTLKFTGERIVPGQVLEPLFREHEARYVFASRFVKHKAVLDLACGTGIGTHYLLTEGANSCVGLDIDRPSVDYARAVYKGCQFIQCDALSLCVPDSSMDAVVSFETIEHLRDHVKFLSECHRVLRPGGALVCSTPNRAMTRWARENPFHLHEFTVAEFVRVLQTIFIDVRVFGQNKVNPLMYAARGLLSRTLHRFQLIRTASRLLRREPPPLCARTEFGGMPIGSDNEVLPYCTSFLMQPRYIIAVAQKST